MLEKEKKWFLFRSYYELCIDRVRGRGFGYERRENREGRREKRGDGTQGEKNIRRNKKSKKIFLCQLPILEGRRENTDRRVRYSATSEFFIYFWSNSLSYLSLVVFT